MYNEWIKKYFNSYYYNNWCNNFFNYNCFMAINKIFSNSTNQYFL